MSAYLGAYARHLLHLAVKEAVARGIPEVVGRPTAYIRSPPALKTAGARGNIPEVVGRGGIQEVRSEAKRHKDIRKRRPTAASSELGTVSVVN